MESKSAEEVVEALGCYDSDGDLCPEDAIQDRLVPAVLQLIKENNEHLLQTIREQLERMRDTENINRRSTHAYNEGIDAYEQALSDILTLLTSLEEEVVE